MACGAARNRRRAEKHHTTGRLLWKALEKAMGDETAQAVSDQMQLAWRAPGDEGLQASGHLRHRRRDARVVEHLDVKAAGVLQAAAQEEGFLPVKPQAMQVDDQACVTAPGDERGCA